jgi:hypothetical protein
MLTTATVRLLLSRVLLLLLWLLLLFEVLMSVFALVLPQLQP